MIPGAATSAGRAGSSQVILNSGLTNCKYAGSSHIILNSGLTNCKYYVVCWVITTGRILVQEFEEITGGMSGHPHEDLILDSGF